MQTRILIADDDVELVELLQEFFESEDFQVSVAHDGMEALEAAGRPGLDLVVLDVMMPEMNGLDVLKEVRKSSRVPVIMLTARGDDLDRILGLELGADDYVPKPCNPRELLARIRAVLRRSGSPSTQTVLQAGDLELNQGNRTVVKNGALVDLTSTEFSILQTLLQHAGGVVSKRELYLSALGREPVAHDRSVDMHVSNLRRKLGPNEEGENRIETVRGIGYQYRVP
jgi:two-component system response regulator CpxR